MLAADDSARVIAGGQTLVPMMVMRLARPTRLIDINRIAALAYIRKDGDGGRHRRHHAAMRGRARCDWWRQQLPLLARAVPWIGHTATRARGTVGGSLANADPAAELPLIAVTLDAVLSYRAGGKTSTMPAREFFVGAMVTALAGRRLSDRRALSGLAGEKIGIGFHEVNARRSDFAFVAAAAQVELGDGRKMQTHRHRRRRGNRFPDAA